MAYFLRLSFGGKSLTQGSYGTYRKQEKATLFGKSKKLSPNYNVDVSNVPSVSHVASPGQSQWYPPIIIGADTIAARLFNEPYVAAAIALTKQLTWDDYTAFLLEFYSNGLRELGATWRYADIVTVLLCLSETLKPRSYLEIGVRRGRSVAAVASRSKDCSLVLLDMWIENYAGMENPGAEFVREELIRVGHKGPVRFIEGDSRKTLPELFREKPHPTFDLITVDGDHGTEGAIQDLCSVLPRLNTGGGIVFDDVCHPLHPELARVWQDLVVADSRFSSFTYTDAGYGVGFAIRKY
jgi:predicted O-methyltransferase YrrM